MSFQICFLRTGYFNVVMNTNLKRGAFILNRLHIRHATPTDAASITKIHIQSWQETYADIFLQTFLDSLQVQERQKH